MYDSDNYTIIYKRPYTNTHLIVNKHVTDIYTSVSLMTSLGFVLVSIVPIELTTIEFNELVPSKYRLGLTKNN